MAKITNMRKIPAVLVERANGKVIDEWFKHDCIENSKDYRKIVFRYSLTSFAEKLDLYFGFVFSFSSNDCLAPIKFKWNFVALRLESNIKGAAGRWSNTDFEDAEFEKIWNSVKAIPGSVTAKAVLKIVKDFNLESRPHCGTPMGASRIPMFF